LQGSKIKPTPIHKLETIKTAMNSVQSDYRHKTKIQNMCI